jgi:hypothetical protein
VDDNVGKHCLGIIVLAVGIESEMPKLLGFYPVTIIFTVDRPIGQVRLEIESEAERNGALIGVDAK